MKEFQTPRGTQDILMDESGKWHRVEGIMEQIASFYGYKEIRTPIFEDAGVFSRENDTSDMVTKEMYTFSVNHEDYLSLRPEGTAGAIRSYVQHKLYALPDQPVKMYYLGPMFRYERPQKGRQRQFTQFGIEAVGAKSPLIDAEGIALGYSIVKALGLQNIVVKINTLGNDASRQAYRERLKDYFRPEIGNLCSDCQRRLETNPLRILDCKADSHSPLLARAPRIGDDLDEDSRSYFEEVLKALDALEIPYEIDQRLVRGLDYYTHTVFEIQNTEPGSGAQSTIFGGGRYDGLVSYFGGPEVSGFGYAMGIERLLMLAEVEGQLKDDDEGVDVYVMSLGSTGTKPLEIATQCRALGYVTELNYLPRSLKAQFKTVEREKAKAVIIAGETELAEGMVNIKNTRTQEQLTVGFDDIEKTLDKMLGGGE